MTSPEPTSANERLCFADGLVVEHRDEFDFYRWARQALGPAGLVLGWTPLVKSSVRRRARAALDEFLNESEAVA